MSKVILADVNSEMINAWKDVKTTLFKNNVEILHCDFREIKDYDCIVSAGNSFGLMDGGIDLAISEHFGWATMTKIQSIILDKYCGELSVGNCILLPLDGGKFLAYVPTMRLPMDIRGTDNVYTATFSALNTIHQYNLKKSAEATSLDIKIKSVVFCGLGTGYGRMSPKESARQMGMAFKNYSERIPLKTAIEESKIRSNKCDDKSKQFYLIDWKIASEKQQAIGAGGTNGLLNWLYKEYPHLEEIIYDSLLKESVQ